MVVHRADKAKEAKLLVDQLNGHVEVVQKYDLESLKPGSYNCDFVIVVGGDGTVLKTAKIVDKPVLGFKAGRIGFLASYTLDQVEVFLRDLHEGKLLEEKRWMLKVIGKNGSYNAINDLVVMVSSKKMAEFRLSFDGCSDLIFFSDGILACTPTGSTAYNLSLGGAIVSPNCDVIQIMPIAPYFLQNRSIIVPTSQKIKLWSHAVCDVMIDGVIVEKGSEVFFTKSEKVFSLLRPDYYDFFAVLKNKVGYGRGITD